MFKKVAGRMRLDPENVTHVRLHSSVIVTRYSATISGEKVRPQRLYQAAGTISSCATGECELPHLIVSIHRTSRITEETHPS